MSFSVRWLCVTHKQTNTVTFVFIILNRDYNIQLDLESFKYLITPKTKIIETQRAVHRIIFIKGRNVCRSDYAGRTFASPMGGQLTVIIRVWEPAECAHWRIKYLLLVQSLRLCLQNWHSFVTCHFSLNCRGKLSDPCTP